MKTRSLMACAILALGLAGTVAVQAQSLKKVDGVLVDTNGMTVYTFDKDTIGDGKSVCNGPCATNWPPVPATDKVAAPYSVVTRDDGSKQLAYKGKPLYLFAADKKPGDRAGDNVKDIWHVVKD
ncbi:hypothetical protein [uncultured Oxalicibacterium sp.]|uniref:COG4315 family predicted lipoprotein n=1 Tax=uncultured Oxalicibacterium sp. TaxID=1168540 RepID=UPI0025E39545|nr:hypothetical protein [uncultured Oxalicibacterium sp.]